MDSCPSIKNVLLLDSEGKRVAVKYYTVFTKTLKTNARTEVTAEIAILDGYIVIYKFVQDLHLFVTGGDDENELIIATVLQGFFDAVGLLLRNNVDKRSALENLDSILLCLEEQRRILLKWPYPSQQSLHGKAPITTPYRSAMHNMA